MSLLTNKLPTTIAIKGVEYPVKTDFRVFIEFEMIIFGESITVETIVKLFRLCFDGEIPPVDEASIDALIKFYAGGKEPKASNEMAEKSYFYDHDDSYIYAAFLDQYNIDLQMVEHMHWWKFRSLFMSLKEDNEISKIMGYRTFKPSAKTPLEMRKFYAKMKELYEPPKSESEEDERKAANDWVKSFSRGGEPVEK